jgi:hypothetical protein
VIAWSQNMTPEAATAAGAILVSKAGSQTGFKGR